MSVSIVVPFNPDGAERERNWRWLRCHYEEVFPEWGVTVGGCAGIWRKGEALKTAVDASSGEVLVIADADVMISARALDRSVELVKQGVAWVQPHRIVYRLSDAATRDLIEGRLQLGGRPPRAQLAREPRRAPVGGGIAVLSREAFDRVGGIDPRFVGWGGEDISFGRALETLVGPCKRLGQALWHLWHPPMQRRLGDRASETSEALAGRYLDASGNPKRMAALISEAACLSL